MSRRDLLGRVLVTALCLTAWRALVFVPLPGLNVHGGSGPIEEVSPVALGLGPYVNAFVIIVVLRLVSSRFNSMVRGASIGRYRAWELLVTAAVATLSASRYIRDLQSVSPGLFPAQVDQLTSLVRTLALPAGTLALYGLGLLINLRGIGVAGRSTGLVLIYGLDILIRGSGDFATAMAHRATNFSLSADLRYLVVPLMAVALTALAVAFDRATRRIPIRFGRSSLRGGAEHSSLPLHLLSSGVVLPVVTAAAAMYLPAAVAAFLSSSPMPTVHAAAEAFQAYWRPDGPLIVVDALYLTMNAGLIVYIVVILAWFWIDPASVASQLREHGATVPGVRPDGPTARHLGRVLTRLSFVGGVCLALAVVATPVLAAGITSVPRSEAYFDGFAIVLTASTCMSLVRGLEQAERRQSSP